MSNTRIVLLSGKQGSGKTTLQNKIHRRWDSVKGQWAHIVNFADPLYKMHAFCRGIVSKYHPKPQYQKDGRLLQLLGTEWGREILGEDVWVKMARDTISDTKSQAHEDHLFIVGDCRFQNEFDAFPDALRVRLQCDEDTRRVRCESWRETTGHQSEIDLDGYAANDKFDLYIDTTTFNADEASELVLAQLHKQTWKEKRKWV